MIRIEAKLFGYYCAEAGLLKKGDNVAALCQVFTKEVAPKLDIKGGMPSGGQIQAMLVRDHGPLKRQEAIDVLSEPMSKDVTAPVVIAVLGENHNDPDDLKRAEDAIKRFMSMRDRRYANALLFLERGLKKKHDRLLQKHGDIIVDEQDIVDQHGSEINRSVIAAAYCVACLAGGDQSKKARVLMLFGQNHMKDIVEAFGQLMASGPFPWIANRARALHMLKTAEGR